MTEALWFLVVDFDKRRKPETKALNFVISLNNEFTSIPVG